jgi:hypothetical protein
MKWLMIGGGCGGYSFRALVVRFDLEAFILEFIRGGGEGGDCQLEGSKIK